MTFYLQRLTLGPARQAGPDSMYDGSIQPRLPMSRALRRHRGGTAGPRTRVVAPISLPQLRFRPVAISLTRARRRATLEFWGSNLNFRVEMEGFARVCSLHGCGFRLGDFGFRLTGKFKLGVSIP